MTKHVYSVCRTGCYHLRNINSSIPLSRCSEKICARNMKNRLLHFFTSWPANDTTCERLQNTCARIITRTSRRAHITPVRKELHWLPVHCRIQYKILSNTFRTHHEAPEYFSGLLSVYRPTRSMRSESTFSLTVPRTRITHVDRTFTNEAATLWNSLPPDIRNPDNCIIFQQQWNTYLFRQEKIGERTLRLPALISFKYYY